MTNVSHDAPGPPAREGQGDGPINPVTPPPRVAGSVAVLARLVRYAVAYKSMLALTLFSMVATAGFAIATPVLLQWAVDTGLGVQVVNDTVQIDVDETLIVVVGLALLGAAALRGLFQFLQSYLAESMGQAVAYDIRTQLYARLQTLSFSYHDESETGQIMVRATQDVEVVRMFLNMGGVRLLFTTTLLFTVMILMFITSWQVTLVAWAFMALIGVRSAYVSRRMRPIWNDVQEGQARLGTVLQEALTGIRVVKAFAREQFEGRKFGVAAQWLYERSFQASMVSSEKYAVDDGALDGRLGRHRLDGGNPGRPGRSHGGRAHEVHLFPYFVADAGAEPGLDGDDGAARGDGRDADLRDFGSGIGDPGSLRRPAAADAPRPRSF